MASKEPFLPIPTEEVVDIERSTVSSIPTAATYNPNFSVPIATSSTFVEHLNVDVTGNRVNDDEFPNTAGQHMMCFNCCCDFRRAVLIVNGISIGLKLLEMMGIAIMASYLKKNVDEIEYDLDDDNAVKTLDSLVKGGLLGFFEVILEVLETINIGLYICGIYGALKFKEWGIITAACAYAFQLVLGIISFDIGNIIVTSCFLYPHFFMLKLMRAGIMTEYNYHKFASCCGDRKL
jgi:hypothetical protein